MGVDPEGEAGVGVAEVVGDGADGLAGVDEHGSVEVAQRVHAVVPSGRDAGGLEGGLPGVGVEVVAVDRLALPAREHEVVAFGRPSAEVLGQLGAYGVG